MKRNALRIKTQFQIGFTIILFFVILLGYISWTQNNQIAEQTQILYDHPFRVRGAIGNLKADVLSIHRFMKDPILSTDETMIANVKINMAIDEADAFAQIDILYENYLGPLSDIDSINEEFIKWNSIRAGTVRLMEEGNREEAAARTFSNGVGGRQADAVLDAIQVVDDFSRNKTIEIYNNSQNLKKLLSRDLLILLGVILASTLGLNYFLLRSINIPLAELTNATQSFRAGDYDSRSHYAIQNEFGMLSDSYNLLADSVQTYVQINEKKNDFTNVMLSSDEVRQFFQSTMEAIVEHSGAQMAAVYLLSNDEKSYKHFVSVGMDEAGKETFDAQQFEGEFGLALSSKKIQHIANIPEDSRFTFQTVTGKFMPREVITIPVLSNDKVVAIISLISIYTYHEKTMQFLHDVWPIMNARAVTVLTIDNINKLFKKLEQQNLELDAQKTELSSQTVELNQQNIELEMQKRQLTDANRMKTRFISNMSHELRTPLNSVIALSGVLNRRLANQIPEEEYSYLEVIERNGKQLLELINDILDISRIEAGQEEIEISQFDINQLVQEIVSIIKPLAEQKSIEMRPIPNPDLNQITSDYRKCRHILQNLVGNAVKFTEAGYVEISIHQKLESIQINIKDTGIGISKDLQTIIFDEFRQADSSTSRKYGGTGLGLSIAKKYAQILGGNISVESSLGTGSLFTFSLPLMFVGDFRKSDGYSKRQITDSTLPILLSPSVDQSQKTILIVDDSKPAIIQLRDILDEYAYTIQVAKNGEEALLSIERSQPDAIILDLMMPKIDGFQVLAALRENETTAHLPILILTAKHISKEELQFLKRNNIHQLIQKGDVNRIELVNAVTEMIDSHTPSRQKPESVIINKGDKPLVLVVEDNLDNLLTAKALLSDEFEVIEAIDGEIAIELAKNYIPHLILMDIALPKMDGVETFKNIRLDPRLQNVPIIALTASNMTNDRETILAHGFDGFISKPIDHEEFKHTIKKVLYGSN